MRGSSCMGGWCHVRERCGHYRPGDPLSAPVERMCVPRGHEQSEPEHFAGGKWFFMPIEPESMEAVLP